MLTQTSSATFPLVGQVVETFEREGRQIAKVALRPCCVEVPLAPSTDAHLGDTVMMEAGITIQNVEPHT
jgi:hypothetical protein